MMFSPKGIISVKVLPERGLQPMFRVWSLMVGTGPGSKKILTLKVKTSP